MSKPDFRLCDVCGSKSVEGEVFAATGREQDASGNGYNTVGSYLDLCPKHMRLAVMMLLTDSKNHRVEDYDAGDRLIQWVARNKIGG
jgi:hypothetical protein